MLKVFRDNLKSLAWVLWVVIIVLVLSLAVEFGNSTPQGAEANVAATVGDETVSVDDFRRQYQQMEQMYRQIYGEQFTPEIAQRLQLPMQALNRAVNQKILLAEAERLDLRVTDEELQSEILSIAAFKDDKGRFIGQETYQRILQQNYYTVATFEEEMRKDILLKKLEDMLRANLYVSDTEVEQAYREQVERAKIRYVQLPRSRFLQGVEIPQSEIQAYYDAHKNEFKLPAQREVAYFLVEPARLAEQLKLTDQDLEAYYDAHKTEFSRQEQVRARHILVMVNDQRTDEQARQRIEEARTKLAGGDFAAVAKAYSDDPGSKDSGGDLGVFGRGQMLPEFEQAAFSAEPGKLVGPVKTSAGYHLIEVSEKTAGGTQPFADPWPRGCRAGPVARRGPGQADRRAPRKGGDQERGDPAGDRQGVPRRHLDPQRQVRRAGPRPRCRPLRPLQPGGLRPEAGRGLRSHPDPARLGRPHRAGRAGAQDGRA
jgi:peptidyl-prolyl cis-trans isomerase D